MPFAAAWSCHPQPASALGECLGQLLEDHGPHPDLALLFVTPGYSTPDHRSPTDSSPSDSSPVDGLLGTIAALLAPAALMAISAGVLLVDSQRIERRPALALWAGWDLAACRAVRLELGAAIGLLEWIEQGEPARGQPGAAAASLLLMVEPRSFPVQDLLADVGELYPGLVVNGTLGPCQRWDWYPDGGDAKARGWPAAAEAAAGLFAAPAGPVGSPGFLHGFTASAVLLQDRSTPS